MRKHWKYSSLFFLGLLLAACGVWAGRGVLSVSRAASSSVLDSFSRAAVAEAFDRAGSAVPIASPRAAILPHHFTARPLIAELVLALQASTPSTIVIVGPDHQNAGPTFATTTTSDWVSGSDRFRINRDLAERLDESKDVSVNDDVIRQEHSVFVPLLFLAKQFPNARFVFLTLRGGFDQRLVHTLADQLDALLGQDDLVLASVDFSHSQMLGAAEADDAVSRELLERGDPDALGTIPADSPASLAVIMRYAKRRGASALTILQHGNSARLLGDPTLQNTTGYFTGVFAAP